MLQVVFDEVEPLFDNEGLNLGRSSQLQLLRSDEGVGIRLVDAEGESRAAWLTGKTACKLAAALTGAPDADMPD